MDRVFSPKRLQKEGRIQEALEYYKKRYYECLEEKDSFLSSLYLDEIAQTLIIGSEEVTVAGEQLSFEQLHQELVRATALESLDREEKEQANLDIQITLRKRFPEKFKEIDSEQEDQAD